MGQLEGGRGGCALGEVEGSWQLAAKNSMSEFDDNSEGISPRTAGILLALVALVGIGIAAIGVLVNRNADPIYDLDNPGAQTNSNLMETQDLWKKKRTEEPRRESPARMAVPTTSTTPQ